MQEAVKLVKQLLAARFFPPPQIGIRAASRSVDIRRDRKPAGKIKKPEMVLVFSSVCGICGRRPEDRGFSAEIMHEWQRSVVTSNIPAALAGKGTQSPNSVLRF